MTADTEEWERERLRHPMFGESMSKDNMAECWERSSGTYSFDRYYTIRDSIINDLSELDVLNKGRCVLDIGCGPGTFAIPMSRYVKSVTCMDGSSGMLKRLAENADTDNIYPLEADWNEYVPDGSYDVAFTSLCPPTNSPESLMKMEKCTGNTCVYISSINNDDSIHIKIWKKLGKNYSYVGYNTEYPYRFLKSIGRDAEMRTYSQKSDIELSYDAAFKGEISRLSQYIECDENVNTAVRSVLDAHSKDGVVRYCSDMTLGMIVWNPTG